MESAELPTSPSPWSVAASWGTGDAAVLPKDGDEVVIKPNMWIELDLAETPKLKKLEINGRLSFKNDA